MSVETIDLTKDLIKQFILRVRKNLVTKEQQLGFVNYETSPLFLLYEAIYNNAQLGTLNDCWFIVNPAENLVFTWAYHEDGDLMQEAQTIKELSSFYKVTLSTPEQHKLMKEGIKPNGKDYQLFYDQVKYYIYDAETQLETEGKKHKGKRKSLNSLDNSGVMQWYPTGHIDKEDVENVKDIINKWAALQTDAVQGWTFKLIEILATLDKDDREFFNVILIALYSKENTMAAFSITEKVTEHYVALLDGKSDRDFDDRFYSVNKAFQFHEIKYWYSKGVEDVYFDLGSGDTYKKNMKEPPSLDKFKLDLHPYRVNEIYGLRKKKRNVSSRGSLV